MFLAERVTLSTIYWFTLSLTLSPQERGLCVSMHFPKEPKKILFTKVKKNFKKIFPGGGGGNRTRVRKYANSGFYIRILLFYLG
jgi:hypothetical protein